MITLIQGKNITLHAFLSILLLVLPTLYGQNLNQTELIEKRTLTSKTFINEDGSYTAELSTAPMHFLDDHGRWQNIDLTINSSANTGFDYVNERNLFKAFFLKTGELILEIFGNEAYCFNPIGLQNAKISVSENNIKFDEAWGEKTSLEYRVEPGEIKVIRTYHSDIKEAVRNFEISKKNQTSGRNQKIHLEQIYQYDDQNCLTAVKICSNHGENLIWSSICGAMQLSSAISDNQGTTYQVNFSSKEKKSETEVVMSSIKLQSYNIQQRKSGLFKSMQTTVSSDLGTHANGVRSNSSVDAFYVGNIALIGDEDDDIIRGYLWWDTSPIPDCATIDGYNALAISIYGDYYSFYGGNNLIIDLKQAIFDPLQDSWSTIYSSIGGAGSLGTGNRLTFNSGQKSANINSNISWITQRIQALLPDDDYPDLKRLTLGLMSTNESQKSHWAQFNNPSNLRVNYHVDMTSSGTLSEDETWTTSHELAGNVEVPSGITLTMYNLNINLNGYYLISTGGTIIRQSNVNFSPKDIQLKSGSTIKGQFSTIQSAINNSSSGQTILVAGGTHNESVTIDKNLTIEGSGTPSIVGHTQVSCASAQLQYLSLKPGSAYGQALGVYNGSALVHSCYVGTGAYTGWYGIWCSSGTLQMLSGSAYAGSNARIMLVNPGSSTYIHSVTRIDAGCGIALSGTADGEATENTFWYDGWDINAYFASSGTFELDDNGYGYDMEIYDPIPYNVSGDGWPPGGLAKGHLSEKNASITGGGDLDAIFDQADSLIASGNFTEGIDLLKTIINDYSDSPDAVYALHKLVSYRNEKDLQENTHACITENQFDLGEIIKRFPDGHPLNVKARECDIHNDVRLGDVEQAISRAFAFYEAHSELECGKRVLLSIAIDIHSFITKDEEAARKVYAMFVENHPEHPMAELAKARLEEMSPGSQKSLCHVC
ncbi:hypothetical protein JXJ21_13470 [candidate division KSB1 bacterium]|nr:hypothetical protein [candidate division KSB1 bacterium]